jgi:transposase InsO family protein
VWWLRLGIRIERIKPGKPQQNGRHERMHLTLKKEAFGLSVATSCSSRRGLIGSCSASTSSARTRR